ncbi:MAG: PIN domain-containing protein [Planctomycetota bacterium]
MNAVDTNVLVYSVDHDEPVKQAKAIALLDQLTQPSVKTVLPWQVAGEYVSCLRRWQSTGRVTPVEVEQYLNRALALFPLALPTRSVLSLALDLHSRYSLSHWDSMLLAACVEAGVKTLYSEDLGADTVYDMVTVINPFI